MIFLSACRGFTLRRLASRSGVSVPPYGWSAEAGIFFPRMRYWPIFLVPLGRRRLRLSRELAGYALADRIVIPSLHVKESFRRDPTAYAKLFMNPYGVDLEMFPTAQRHNSDKEFTLLFVGSWTLRKGCDLLVSAVARTPGVRLVHVGSIGSDLAFPTDNPRFVHIDPVPQTELARFYAEADAFVLASREDGFGVVLAQALASGLPVICTDRTGGADLAHTPALAQRHYNYTPRRFVGACCRGGWIARPSQGRRASCRLRTLIAKRSHGQPTGVVMLSKSRLILTNTVESRIDHRAIRFLPENDACERFCFTIGCMSSPDLIRLMADRRTPYRDFARRWPWPERKRGCFRWAGSTGVTSRTTKSAGVALLRIGRVFLLCENCVARQVSRARCGNWRQRLT